MLNSKPKLWLLSLLFIALSFKGFCQSGAIYKGAQGQVTISGGATQAYSGNVQFTFPAPGEKVLIKRTENSAVTIYSIGISPQPSDALHIRKMLINGGQKAWLVIDNQTKTITLDSDPATNGKFTKHIVWQLTK